MENFNEWIKRHTGAKTYLENIAHLDEGKREFLLSEIPQTQVRDVLLPQLQFLANSTVDWGFEDLGLAKPEYEALKLHLYDRGLLIPGTEYKFRYPGIVNIVVVEIAEGDELSLPPHWKQGVLVLGAGDRFTWIGKKVRDERYGGPDAIDFTHYRDDGDGWTLVQ